MNDDEIDGTKSECLNEENNEKKGGRSDENEAERKSGKLVNTHSECLENRVGKTVQVKISNARWTSMHTKLLLETFTIFGHDKELLSKLFPGFSTRLVYRKIGEIKSKLEENQWLPKHDEILIKGILKGIVNWEKIRKRYLPRKTISLLIERVNHLKLKFGFRTSEKHKKCHLEEDTSFQSTMHTEKISERFEESIILPTSILLSTLSIDPVKSIKICEKNVSKLELALDSFENEKNVFKPTTLSQNLPWEVEDWHHDMDHYDELSLSNILADIGLCDHPEER